MFKTKESNSLKFREAVKEKSREEKNRNEERWIVHTFAHWQLISKTLTEKRKFHERRCLAGGKRVVIGGQWIGS